MFVNCPSCHALVATDPATDEPPERCPRCAALLRGVAVPPYPAADARSGVAAAVAEVVGGGSGPDAGDPSTDRAAQPAIPIANLLQQESPGPAEAEPDPAPAEAAEEPVPEPGPQADMAPEGPPGPLRAGRSEPSFARRRRAGGDAAPAGRRWPMAAAIAGLALLLGLQWLLAERAHLAADAGWRPLVERTCVVLRCSLPPWREPSAFALLERDVRPHPEAEGALRITASFRNDAAWAQPWPQLVLTLSDIDGRPLGARAFAAAEYLGGEPPSQLIGSGQGAVIRMDVLEPGPGAVGFAFDFR